METVGMVSAAISVGKTEDTGGYRCSGTAEATIEFCEPPPNDGKRLLASESSTSLA